MEELEEYKKLGRVLKELEEQGNDKGIRLRRLKDRKGKLYGDVAMGEEKEEKKVKLKKEMRELDEEIKDLDITIEELKIRKNRLKSIVENVYNLRDI